MVRMVALLIALCTFSTSAAAGDRPFTGFHLGVHAGYGIGHQHAALTGDDFYLPLSGTEMRGLTYGGSFGYDLPLGDRWRIGLLWRSSMAELASTARFGHAKLGIDSEYEVDQLHGIYVRGGYVLGERTFVFGGVGAAAGHGRIGGVATAGPFSYEDSIEGWAVGPSVMLGVEHTLTGRWSVSATVVHSRFEGLFDECIQFACSGQEIEVNPTTVDFGLTFRF